MKLFVDDIRKAPKGWTPARTVTEAIRYLHQFPFEVVSLDHDIMTDCCHSVSWETFEPVAWHISLMRDRPRVMFHTSNPAGGARMASILMMPYTPANYPEDYEQEEAQDGTSSHG